jgi:hypothetical protein
LSEHSGAATPLLVLPTYDLPTRERRLDFVAEAKAFADGNRGNPAFRFLRWFLRCSEAELDQVLGKFWCDSHRRIYWVPESLALSCWKSLAQPFFYLVTKRLVRERGPEVDYDVETVDAAYFERWQRPIYDKLPGRKRVTPSSGARLARPDSADPMLALVTPRTLALMFAAPLALPSLLVLSWRYRRNLVQPYRLALGLYAGFEGHFKRWPTRHYLAYTDDHNHPCRHLAFRQNSSGRMAVIQNGERTLHPVYAFGGMDDYLTFGACMTDLAASLRVKVDRVIPVGALYLNRRLAEMPELAGAPKDIDVLFIDQWTWPENGFDEETGRAYEKSFRRLSELKRERPALRIAYQLRFYRDRAVLDKLLARLRPFFVEPIEILENDGAGISYRSVARARVVVTFQSTMGYEAFFVGRDTKALYANFTPNPYELYCEDPRFQLFDPSDSADRFVRHIDYLLALRLDGPPAAARERHSFTDGQVQERIVAAMTGDGYR